MAGKKSDDRYECLADSLVEESLTEAADTLFGERRRIEQALKEYEDQVTRLLEIQKRVAGCQANLHFLLRRGDPETAARFYRSLGIDPDQVPWLGSTSSAAPAQLTIPFGLRVKSCFAKLVCRAYADLEAEARTYMQGRYYQDPEDQRCMRVTLNYGQVKGFCDRLTEAIARANQSDSFTQALQFSKRLDVERSEKETLAGGPMHYTLDQEMAFKPPDFGSSGLVAFPELPPLDQTRKAIKAFSFQLFREGPGEIRTILREIKKAGSGAHRTQGRQ